jgi:nicotinamide-nucleotide amidase
MNCSIISIGTELLMGQITNSNSTFLSQKLNEIGINVYYHFTVGDNALRLKEILNYAMERSDIIITTGGLGPTQDDLTKETIGALINRNMVLHKPSYDKLCSFFKGIKRPMTENNLKQVSFPEDATILPNDFGTAPGFIVNHKGKMIVSFPGPPKEMTNMYKNYAERYLLSQVNEVLYSKMLRFFGIGESQLETEILDLISNQTNPTIAPYAKDGEVALRITAKAADIRDAEKLVEMKIKQIESKVGKYIYSYEDEEMAEVVGKELIDKGIKISLAESCTGGLICSQLTNVPGISQSFDRGIVTYSNRAKIEELGVKEETLIRYGAVSEETAREMVMGLRVVTGSDVCLAITGIAGPGGGSVEKPVGLVYIAAVYGDNYVIRKLNLSGDRERIRRLSFLYALDIIRKLIKS